jgi:hypothetical protein
MDKPKPYQSDRGFWQWGSFVDTLGVKVRVYESSAARDDCYYYPLWLNVQDLALAQLNDQQVDYLIELLQMHRKARNE